MVAPRSAWSESAPGAVVLDPPALPPTRARAPRLQGPRRPSQPPDDPGDGDGDGGGGGGDGPRREPLPPSGSSEIAFALLLVAVFTLFLVFLAAFVHLRRHEVVWPPLHSLSAPPDGLWGSTLVLVLSSVAMVLAVHAWRDHARRRAQRWLDRATLLGLTFLLVQVWLWNELLGAGLKASSDAYGMIFYALTGLHALHASAGVAWMFVIRRRVTHGPPPSERRSTLEFCALYWHFMGALWLVLFGVLYFLR